MIRSVGKTAVIVFGIASLFISWGCAPIFPEAELNKANKNISFRDLLKDPEKFKGQWVMLSGMIVASKNTKDGALIEVLQKPMDSDGRPLDTDETEGRFLVRSERFLDSSLYHKGRLITVLAEVTGRIEQPIDEIMYQYPLLALKDIHLWSPSSGGPRFFFGIGVYRQL